MIAIYNVSIFVSVGIFTNKSLNTVPRDCYLFTTKCSLFFLPVPPMFGEPASTEVTAVVGTNLTLNCTASGYPAVSISWLYGDSPADNGAVTSTTPTDSDGGTISVTSVFTISGVQVEDTGIYSCVAVNNASSDTREISSVTIVGECGQLMYKLCLTVGKVFQGELQLPYFPQSTSE